MSEKPPLPPGVESLLEDVARLVGSNVSEEHLMGAAAAVGYYVATRNLSRSALLGLLVVTVWRLKSIDGRLEDIGDIDPEKRIQAMRNLEQQVAPEATDE